MACLLNWVLLAQQFSNLTLLIISTSRLWLVLYWMNVLHFATLFADALVCLCLHVDSFNFRTHWATICILLHICSSSIRPVIATFIIWLFLCITCACALDRHFKLCANVHSAANCGYKVKGLKESHTSHDHSATCGWEKLANGRIADLQIFVDVHWPSYSALVNSTVRRTHFLNQSFLCIFHWQAQLAISAPLHFALRSSGQWHDSGSP